MLPGTPEDRLTSSRSCLIRLFTQIIPCKITNRSPIIQHDCKFTRDDHVLLFFFLTSKLHFHQFEFNSASIVSNR